MSAEPTVVDQQQKEDVPFYKTVKRVSHLQIRQVTAMTTIA